MTTNCPPPRLGADDQSAAFRLRTNPGAELTNGSDWNRNTLAPRARASTPGSEVAVPGVNFEPLNLNGWEVAERCPLALALSI